MTTLSSLHPYPAMIADDLAALLAERYISHRDFVVDPFCGTGRTLFAAAELGAECLGIDVNPLAVLLVEAKARAFNSARIEDLIEAAKSKPVKARDAESYELEPDRKVPWFTPAVRRELRTLIRFINAARLEAADLSLVAAVLSATVREVSFCRKDQWKLHRLDLKRRRAFHKAPIDVFLRRLSAAALERRTSRAPVGTVAVARGDARALPQIIAGSKGQEGGCVDVVFTSPPYGDSRTTVGYGAVSGICLGVVRHLSGLADVYVPGGTIDRLCLGGLVRPKRDSEPEVARYVAGVCDARSETRVAAYLSDLRACCDGIAFVLKPGGLCVLVISRRNVGGHSLLLDKYLNEIYAGHGLVLENTFRRALEGKRTPGRVDRKARSTGGRGNHLVATMTEEIVLVFRKKITGGDVTITSEIRKKKSKGISFPENHA